MENLVLNFLILDINTKNFKNFQLQNDLKLLIHFRNTNIFRKNLNLNRI